MSAGNTELFDCEFQWTPLDPLKHEIPDTYRETACRAFFLRNDIVALGSLNNPEQKSIYPPYKEENDLIFLTADGTILYAYSAYIDPLLERNVIWAQKKGYGMKILPKKDALFRSNALTILLYR